MANYAPSNLSSAQVQLTMALQKAELRYRRPDVWGSLKQNSEISAPSYKDARSREDRALTVDFLKRSKRTPAIGRTHNPSGVQSDTAIISPSFATISDTFFTTLKQADKNTRSLQEMFNHEVLNSAINMVEHMNNLASDYIVNNRTGVNVLTQEGSFNTTNDVFEITEASKGIRAFQIASMCLDVNGYQGGGFDVYCDSISYNTFMFQMMQGQANDVNTAFQFQNGGSTFYHMPDAQNVIGAIGAGAYTRGFFVIIPRGMVVGLDWIPKQNRVGISSASIGGVGEYGSLYNPIDGVDYAIFKKWAGLDGSSLNGYTQDVQEVCEISLDYAFEKAPLTNPSETPLFAFGLI